MEDQISIIELLAMLDVQKKLYNNLLVLAQSQQELIVTDVPEALLRVLADRQKVLSKITSVDKDLRVFKENRDEMMSSYSESERNQVNVLLEDIEGILREVLESDQRDAQMLSGKKDEVAKEIKKVKSGSRYNKAYAASYDEQPLNMFDSNNS